ncbi:gamma-tubulin complex component 3 isoform X2 [Nymphaea colorata]|uniref:gamma-tubulin complex component 3 isoform X2 n=1 Tax=Nymphaea colorata TaxID=210225 RepID=UPI00129EBF65|nr:gamma-tubulin complex component 3 isoform X2 [Nymphaea colorata]
MEDQKIADLVMELVLRLLPPDAASAAGITRSHHPPDSVADRAFRYAMRIIASRMSPSVSPDEAAVAESIKRQLVNDGHSSDALAFADLYSKFSLKSGPGCIRNRWALLYLLKVVSDDRRSDAARARGLSAGTVSGGLPALLLDDGVRDARVRDLVDRPVRASYSPTSSRSSLLRKALGRDSGGGLLLVSKDPDNLRQAALREFADLSREESEVSESALVKDVIYACQGIDGRYVKFDREADAYALPPTVRVPRSTRIVVRKLCELGWLFRKVKGYISAGVERFQAEEVGTIGQAFCSALQEELSDYYKLLAVLEAQSLNPIPLMSEAATDGSSSGDYLSLRRLAVWLAEPLVRMRLMAVLVDDCKISRGGAMAGAIHSRARHGDPLVQEFMGRLLRKVCSPLFEMVRSWVLEGELNDVFGEFFILAQPVKAESLWSEGYRLHPVMLPAFFPESLAQRILRTGKSINFLRVCCEDQGWAEAAAEAAATAGTSTHKGELVYGKTEALEALVVEAAKRIDQHLLDVMYTRYKFKDHCLAIKRYLLLGQGDFVQYLMDTVGPELSEPANTISSFKLAGLLESAIRSSNAQYDDPNILERLRVKMMPHDSGDRGWDVFSLDYDSRVPLNTIFTESVMERYLRIFNFLWKLRRVEHALIGAWKNMKPNCTISRLLEMQEGAAKLRFVTISRKCQVLWGEMNNFVTNLQYYIMFEVLEESWSSFLKELDEARDLDALLAAHEKYLNSILEKSLLGERTKDICKVLFILFDLILQFRSLAERLYEGIRDFQSRERTKSRPKSRNEMSKPNTYFGGSRKAFSQFTAELLKRIGEDLDKIVKEYSSVLEGFISQLPVEQHVDLKFLFFRLDFTEFYSRLKVNATLKSI